MDTLTKEQMNAMPAGPEMDALIGLLLGYTRAKGHPDRWITPDGLLSLGVGGLPAFSTDIAAAWPVAEKMIASAEESLLFGAGERFVFEAPRFKHSNGYLTHEGWPLGTTCWVVYLVSGGRRYNVCAETAPLAICRAALIATPVSSAPAVLASV